MICNESGGLIFYQAYHKNAPDLESNEVIIIGSTLHSLHAISVEISPVPKSSGFMELETTSWKLNCLQTITGLKFMIFTDLPQPKEKTDQTLKQVYSLYADYVLKNPFYTIGQPISNSCSKFVSEVRNLIDSINN